jgi:hypothetical protein
VRSRIRTHRGARVAGGETEPYLPPVPLYMPEAGWSEWLARLSRNVNVLGGRAAGAVSNGGGGTTIISGSGVPTFADGAGGDYYIDTDTDTMYGPKSEAAYLPAAYMIPTATVPGNQQSLNARVGNVFKVLKAGRIGGARFYRYLSTTTTRSLYLYDDVTHALLATSNPTVETLGIAGWFEATFPTPIVVAADQQLCIAYDDAAGNYFSSGLAPVTDPTDVTPIIARWGIPSGGGYPTTGSGAYNFFADLLWEVAPSASDTWPVAMESGPGPAGPTGPAGATGPTGAAGRSVLVTESATPPAAPVQGDIWVEHTTVPAVDPPDVANLKMLFDGISAVDLAGWTNPYGAGWSIVANSTNPMPVHQASGLRFSGSQSCRLAGPITAAIPAHATVYIAYQTNIDFFVIISDADGGWTGYGATTYPGLLQNLRHDTYRNDMPAPGSASHILTYLSDATNFQFNLDAVPGPVNASKGYLPNRLGGYWVLGRAQEGYGQWDGVLRGILIYNAIHDGTTQAAVRSYISTQLGVETVILTPYVWDGAEWVLMEGTTGPQGPPGTGGAAVTVADAAPSGSAQGDLWFDSAAAQLYLRYADPNTSQWVPVANQPGPPGPAGPAGGGAGGTVGEAPLDGLSYGRQSAAWTQVLMATGDIVDGGNF